MYFDPNYGTVQFFYTGTTQSIHNPGIYNSRTVSGAYNSSGVFYSATNGVLNGMTSAIFNSLSYMTYTFLGNNGGY